MDIFQVIGLLGDPSDEDEDWDSDFEGEDSDWTDEDEESGSDVDGSDEDCELTRPGTKPFVYSYCYQTLRVPTSSIHFQVADALKIWHPPCSTTDTPPPSHTRLAAIAPSDGASAVHVWNIPSTSTIDKFYAFVPGQSFAAPKWLGGVQLLSDEVYSTAFSDDGNHLFAGCDQGLLTLCQVDDSLPSLPRFLDVGHIKLPIDLNSLNHGWHGSRRPTSRMFNVAGYRYCYPPVLEIERQEQTQQLGGVLKGRWMDYQAYEDKAYEEHWHIEHWQWLAREKCIAVKCALHAMGGKGTKEALEAYLNENMGISLETRIIDGCEHQLLLSDDRSILFEGIKKQDDMYYLQKEKLIVAPTKETATIAKNYKKKKKEGRGGGIEEGEPSSSSSSSSAAAAAAVEARDFTVPTMDNETAQRVLGILFLQFREHLASPTTIIAASKNALQNLPNNQKKERMKQKEKEEMEAASVGLTLEYLSLLCRFYIQSDPDYVLIFLKDLVLSRPDMYTLSSPKEGFPLRVLPRNFPWRGDKWEADHNIQHTAAVSPAGHFILGYPTAKEIQQNIDLVEELRPDGCYSNRVLVWPESMVNGVSVGSVGGVRRMLAAEQSGYIYIFEMPRKKEAWKGGTNDDDDDNDNNNGAILAGCMCESLGEEGKTEGGKVGWVKRPVLQTELRPNYVDSDDEDEDNGARGPPPCLHHTIKSTAAIGPFGVAINNAQCSPDGRWIAVVADGPSVFLVDQLNGFTWEKVPLPLTTNGSPGDVALGGAAATPVLNPVDPGHYGSFYCAWNASSTLFAGSIAAENGKKGLDGESVATDHKIVVWEITREGSSTTTTSGPPLWLSSSQMVEMGTNSSCRVAAVIRNHIGPVLPVKFAPWDDRLVIYAGKKAHVHFSRIPEKKDGYHDGKKAGQQQQQQQQQQQDVKKATGVENMQTVAIISHSKLALQHKDPTILDDGLRLHGRTRITGLEATEDGDVLVSSRQMVVHRFLANDNSYGWTIDRHKSWPVSFQAAVRTLLLCHKRAGAEGLGMVNDLVLLNIIKMAARERCDWVSFELGSLRE